jgi:hypothetical protein
MSDMNSHKSYRPLTTLNFRNELVLIRTTSWFVDAILFDWFPLNIRTMKLLVVQFYIIFVCFPMCPKMPLTFLVSKYSIDVIPLC